MQLPQISSKLSHLEHVPISSLVDFQGSLKELSERNYKKLKKSIVDNGIFVPFFIWVAPDGTCYTMDGHQRLRVFNREGWQMDVPVIRIEAKNEAEAKKKLLIVSSQYGKVTQSGWDDFTWDMEEEWLQEAVHFDGLPFVFGEWDRQEPPDEFPEYDESIADTVEYHECPNCGHKWPK